MKPRLLLTMGDVAGVGPEILARAWRPLLEVCQPVVVGEAAWLQRALTLTGAAARIAIVRRPEEVQATAELVPLLVGSTQSLHDVQPGQVSAAAGRAAYDFLCTAIDWTMQGAAAGIVTLPLHKEGLHAAGLPYPGHTEIIAARTGTKAFGMMLYVRGAAIPHGLAVLHVTLHCALRDVFALLSTAAVAEKIQLLHDLLTRMLQRQPRLAVAALNPHASDGGLFGDEEATLIQPAVAAAQRMGIDVTGPWPSDTLFGRARAGACDGIVAMYHDQGHIALKLLGGLHAVNVSVGMPIVRTSVAHGTAYDIAWRGVAEAEGLVEAARVAAQLAGSTARSGEASDEDDHVHSAARRDGSQSGVAGTAAGTQAESTTDARRHSPG